MKAQPFLKYAMQECKRGKRTTDAINFDERLNKVAMFYAQSFYPKQITDLFEGFKEDNGEFSNDSHQITVTRSVHGGYNVVFNYIKGGRQSYSIEVQSLDDFIRIAQIEGHGVELNWKKEIASKNLTTETIVAIA